MYTPGSDWALQPMLAFPDSQHVQAVPYASRLPTVNGLYHGKNVPAILQTTVLTVLMTEHHSAPSGTQKSLPHISSV